MSSLLNEAQSNQKKPKVLITGILGQDGANMAEFLLRDPNVLVFGMLRRSSNSNFINIKKIEHDLNFKLVYGDLTDEISLNQLVQEIKPDYFINFGANSFVACSWNMPLHVMDVNALGVLRCLEAIRLFQPKCRFYSAGSSEEFGNVDYSPQDIAHPIKARSPYGASKAAARHLVKVYRESYNIFAVHGILFNHEGTKRGEEFVTRKISKGVARIAKAIKDNKPFLPIELGNLSAERDWSDSEDFVKGVWLMLNQDKPKNYVLSSNETHSIREFVEKAFLVANIPGFWQGLGIEQKYYLANYIREEFPDMSGCLVRVNPKFYRPAEVEVLLGDSNPIRMELGWEPKVSFLSLVEKMVLHDIDILSKE